MSLSFNSEWDASNQEGGFLGPFGFPFSLFSLDIPIGIIVYALVNVSQVLSGNQKVTAALVVERESNDEGIIIHLELLNGDRLNLEPVSSGVENAFEGDYGWGYISRGYLVDFLPGKSKSLFS